MRNLLTGLLAGLAACIVASAASAQQFTMKLSSPTINDVTHEWMKAFKAGVEDRSKGRVKVEIYPANQLGQIPRARLVAAGQACGLHIAGVLHAQHLGLAVHELGEGRQATRIGASQRVRGAVFAGHQRQLH